MGKIMKIFKDETNVYSGNCYVNSVIFRGRIYGEFHGIGRGEIKFALQLSNGKNGSQVCAVSGRSSRAGEQEKAQRIANGSEQSDNALDRAKTGTQGKPTFADCTAFGEVAKRILKEYKSKDEIWIIAKYYSKQHGGKFYKGFIVRDIISDRERVTAQDNSRVEYSEKGSNDAREASNSGAFCNDDLPF